MLGTRQLHRWFALRSSTVATGTPAATVRPGARAPQFELPGLNGGRRSLAVLRMMGQPVVLLFVDDPSAACSPVLAAVARRQDDPTCEATIVVVACGTAPVRREKVTALGLRNVVVDDDARLGRRYGWTGSPSAALIGVDGRIARLARGADDVRDLLLESCGPWDDADGVAIDPGADDPAWTMVPGWLDEVPSAAVEVQEAEALRRYRGRHRSHR